MPIREYKCESCKLLDEKILNGEPPETVKCARCGADATLRRIPSSIALARSGMDNAPLDNFIGKDAEKRWTVLKDRQAKRESVRKETHAQGLTAVGLGNSGAETYKPITPEQKTMRTGVTQAIEGAGYGSTLPVPGN